MRIAFRLDSSTEIGSGHLMRCLAQARALRARGAEVVFVCAALPGSHAGTARRAGFDVMVIEPLDPSDPDFEEADAEATAAALVAPVDLLAVDHYGLSSRWERMMRSMCDRILVIDDLADRSHDADLLVDPTWPPDPARYDGLVAPATRRLLGPRYALMSSDISDLHDEPYDAARPPRLLVFFGGSDLPGMTGRTLQALAEGPPLDVDVDVVIGATNPHAEAARSAARVMTRVTVHEALPSLAPLLARSTASVGAGGVAMWERLCAGVPSIVISLADNQVPATSGLSEAGVIAYLGPDDAVTPATLGSAVRALLGDPDLRRRMSEAGRSLVDGRGAERIAEAVLPHSLAALRLRRATQADRELLFAWANDPDVRRSALRQDPILWSDHTTWFDQRLADPRSWLYVLETPRLPVGQVRLEATGDVVVLDYSLDEVARGRGWGRRLVSHAIRNVRQHTDLPIIADVRAENIASRATLVGAGFTQQDDTHQPGVIRLVLERGQYCVGDEGDLLIRE